MKFRICIFTYLWVILLVACSNPTPRATIDLTTTPPPATPIPTETRTPNPTETPVPPPPTMTQELSAHPGPRAMADMVFHEGLGMVVMLNGSREENFVWGWNGTQWQVLSEGGPNTRSLGGMVYDPSRDKLVVYGGYSLTGSRCQYDTWEWDEQGWQSFDTPGPDVCSHFVMEYDTALEKVVLFGGADDRQATHPGMWAWDGQSWERLEIESPATRFHMMSATDPVHNTLFLLGGFDVNYLILDEFWIWDGTTWDHPNIPRPTALSHARMAFDTNRQQLVLFGGSTRARIPLDLQDGTWVLTDNTWQQVSGAAPSPRGGQAMAYDPIRDRVVLYGGFADNDQELADTWEWRGLGWTCVDGCEPGGATDAPPAFSTGVVLYRGDAHRAGVYDFPSIRTLPEQVWQAATNFAFLDNLLLHDGVLYTGTSNGKLYAFDALTGNQLWRGGDFNTAVSAVAIAGDVIVIGGYPQFVQALDRRTGEVLWTTDTVGRTLAPPLILDDQVYVSATNAFYSLNLQTGEVLWEAPLPSDNEFDFISAPAYEAGKLYMSVGHSFVALDAETGETVWQITKETYFYFSAVGQYAYVGNGDGFYYAYDLETGEEVWKFEGGNEIWFGPAVTEDMVFVGHFNQFMYALDARTGDKRWEFETSNWAVSDAVLSDGVLYFTDCNHEVPLQECHLYAVEAETGTPLWTYSATGTLLPTPVLGDGVMYIILSNDILALR